MPHASRRLVACVLRVYVTERTSIAFFFFAPFSCVLGGGKTFEKKKSSRCCRLRQLTAALLCCCLTAAFLPPVFGTACVWKQTKPNQTTPPTTAGSSL